ncbi:acetyltransferase (GNAT) family protein [Humitalea rosea]|uniref:Acetyltransferase (GNAT) family protein n=1 Tax=Humitalea rosea TaxID=990373 RepID=A0A2W7K3R4_9PROT|nr:GNAT family N-acetyltransferase [Humitalea rosea]PZW42260.1 acetyltransferase (GNAT) family protein [Humitalea rosea]
MSPPIRRARPDEAAACTTVIAAAFTPWIAVIGRIPGPMADDPVARIAAGQCWVLPGDGGLAGVLVLEEKDGDLWLDTVAVLPDLTGQGLGRRLIAFAEAEARTRGHARLRLYTHVLMAANRRLYARLGYAETGYVTQDGFERVVMEKPLG